MFEAPVKKSAAAQGAQGAAIAGCRVSTGQIVKEGKYRVVRGGKVLTEGLLVRLFGGPRDGVSALTRAAAGCAPVDAHAVLHTPL